MKVKDITSPEHYSCVGGPFGSNLTGKDYIEGPGIPVSRGNNVSLGTRYFHDDDFVFVSEEKATSLMQNTAYPGDLVFTQRGTIGGVALIPQNAKYPKYILSQNQMKLKPDLSRVNVLFLCYYFLSPVVRDLVARSSIGSAIPGFNLTQLRDFPVPVPPLAEQEMIASILGALDDKIELNRRMNETLEAMARAIFKSWFVDFDPVRAKAEGRDPALPKHVADVFPDGFEDSELGEIPAGWSIDTLGNLIGLAYGKALKEEDRKSGDIAVFGSNGQVGCHDEKLVAGPGIVVGRKGNPGIVIWAPTDFFPIDTTFYVVPNGGIRSLHFLFYALKMHDLASLGADSAVPGLNRNIVYMSKQIVPSTSVLEVFDSMVQPLFHHKHQAETESGTLAALRDTLLPKLISGELRVPHASANESAYA